jgi:magnesium transporter
LSLVLAPPHETVKTIKSKDIISIYVHQSLDEIMEVFEKSDYLAIPVVSKSGKLLGMISRDDVLQRQQDDTEDDLFRLNRVNPEEFRGAPLLKIIPFRLPWLAASMLGGLLNALILSHYTKLLEVVIILSLYIPVLLGLAETVATQTSTLIIRGIETGQLASMRFRQMLFKEIFVGLLLGFISGVILGVLTYLWTGMANIGMILTFSVCLSVTIASIFGTVVPLVMKALKFDPAVASSPFILSGSDICAISIYLYTAALMLSNRG